MTEGGIRSPMIAYWPGMIKENTVSSHLSAFWDFLPTVSDLIGEPIDGRTDGISMLMSFGSSKSREIMNIYIGNYMKVDLIAVFDLMNGKGL